ENVQHDGKSIFTKELEKQDNDIHFPFRNVRDILLKDDLTMINFEGTLTTAGRNPDKRNNDYLFRASPEWVDMLPAGGVETVSLENNHVLDMGADGLAETKQTLLSAGISYASENEPATFYVKGVKIGSLAYQTFGGRHDELIAKVPGDIQALRDQGCELIIVSYHWGNEKDYAPNDNQVRLGRATVDAGADLVIGHHSHRINPIEYYNGKYICYSLGNFSFAGNNKPDDMATFIFQVRMRVKDGVATSDSFKIIPCRISSRTDYNDFAPTPYTKATNVEAVVKTLKSNGKKLEYAVEDYPLKWSDEE
ncbi:MAG: CapA family protein, partial [Clostridia bacterium]|nr:CapA family protein [Clostridia bacterium]